MIKLGDILDFTLEFLNIIMYIGILMMIIEELLMRINMVGYQKIFLVR